MSLRGSSQEDSITEPLDADRKTFRQGNAGSWAETGD